MAARWSASSRRRGSRSASTCRGRRCSRCSTCRSPRGRTRDEVAPALVEHLCNQALERGAHRLFVRLPERDPLLPVFRLRGFRQYATEVRRLRRQAGDAREAVFRTGARPIRRGDHRLLYQLYRKVTPQGVSQLEAPTYREWRALHGEWTGRLAARGSEKQELVVDQVELTGWVKAERSSGARPNTLSFMALPESIAGERAGRPRAVAAGRLGPARPGRACATMIRT